MYDKSNKQYSFITTMILQLFIYFAIDHFYLSSFTLLTLKHYALK